MNYPMEKYRYYQNGDTIIAVTTYAGKTVRGVAKCSPSDKFSLEDGKKLAAMRCNIKVARKRYERACKKAQEALAESMLAQQKLEDMRIYADDSINALIKSTNDYEEYLKTL